MDESVDASESEEKSDWQAEIDGVGREGGGKDGDDGWENDFKGLRKGNAQRREEKEKCGDEDGPASSAAPRMAC